jgi:hypothetical protein
MPTVVDLVARSGELKRELVEFAQHPRFGNELQRAFDACLGGLDWVDDEQACNALDYFVFQHRLRDGRTVVESFTLTRSDLDEPERAMLLGWRDVVEGLFEVRRRDGDALILVNLVDELTYRVRSNVGTAAFRPMRPRSFLRTRLVPVGDDWLLSGISQVFPTRSRDALYRAAAELSLRCPAWVFRNPDKLARGWELQRRDRADFVEFFAPTWSSCRARSWRPDSRSSPSSGPPGSTRASPPPAPLQRCSPYRPRTCPTNCRTPRLSA